jgi:Leucine-rich repeat (LRR) protein
VAANNGFVEFPMVLTAMNRLENLDLSNNKIEALPGEISMMSGLNKLNIMNNQLTDVPVELADLSRLTSFDYQGNPFSPEIQQKIMDLMTGNYQKPAPPKKKAVRKAPVKRKAKR